MGRIAPAESDLTMLEGNQSVVRDGNAMGITAEILQHVLRSPERPFGVNDPVTLVGAAHERTKELGLSKRF